MATNTYVALQTTTLTGNEGAVTFTSIPQGYTDLRIVYNGTGSTTIPFALRFNGDSGSNYSYTILYGSGSSAASTRGSNQAEGYLGNVWTDQNTIIVDIMNYSNTTTYKTQISRANSAGNRVAAWVNLWRSTAAITEILVTATGGGTYQAGSIFTIYGIAAIDATPYATGGAISSDATYFYHSFASTGTFTPTQNLTNVDYLVVAGGGGGRAKIGGGGGAGGYRTTVGTSGGGASAESKISLNNGTAYTIQVGAGGTGQANGTDSYISGTGLTTITSLGGGYGGWSSGSSGTNPNSGGSGGGGAGPELSSGTMAGGAGTANQGYAGGAGKSGSSSPYPGHSGGPGGGAGGVGPSTTSTSGIGGPGLTSDIDGITRGGGGGAGAQYSDAAWAPGGVGGGGAGGGYFLNPKNGLPGTGGGGGGGGYGGSADTATSQGGSGIVIIRYPK